MRRHPTLLVLWCSFSSAAAFVPGPPHAQASLKHQPCTSKSSLQHEPVFLHSLAQIDQPTKAPSHIQPSLHLRASASNDAEDKTSPRPGVISALIYGELRYTFPTLLGVLAVGRLIRAATAAPLLFRLHVSLASSAVLALLPTAVGTVRSRVAAAKSVGSRATATEKRNALKGRVVAHFAITTAAGLSVLISLISIVWHKNRMGAAHLTTLHSRLGAAAFCVWFSAWAVAETKVWTPMLKRWRLGKQDGPSYDPAWLWASAAHRRLGIGAVALALGAAGTGVATSTWGRLALSAAERLWLLVAVGGVQAYILVPGMREALQRRERRRKRHASQ